MKTYFLAGAALLISGPAAAQQAQTADDFVCALAGECAKTDTAAPTTADVADEEPAAPTTMAKPKTKGFVLPKARAASAATPAAAPRASNVAPVRVAVATPGNRAVRRPSATLAAPRSVARVASAPVAMPAGRGELKVEFLSGSYVLTEQAKRNAREFAAAITRPSLSSARFLIEGHTDAVGGRDMNVDLSRKRAQAVLDYLSSQNIDVSRLEARGYGFDRPLVESNPRAPQNRRVEVVKVN